jgi:hypothetical protein
MKRRTRTPSFVFGRNSRTQQNLNEKSVNMTQFQICLNLTGDEMAWEKI